MSRPLTTRTHVALAIARGIAAAMGHDKVTPVHITLGLLREGENPAVAALDFAGIARPEVRRALEAALEPRGYPHPGEVVLPLSPGEQQVLEQAAAEADARQDEYLGTEHLLIAILRDGSNPAAEVLARHGFGVDAAVAHLQIAFGQTPPRPPGTSNL